MTTNLANLLQQGLQTLHLSLSPVTQTQLLNYLQLLSKWNHVYNLTAIREIETMLAKHILDSLAVLPYLKGQRLLDVGTGAGVPGLVLAMAQPTWQWVLIDSNAKKLRFVQQAIMELEITNVEIVKTRIEDYSPVENFNTILCRAYSSLSEFYHQTARLCAIEGCLLAMKGTYPVTEMAELTTLPISIQTIALQVPQLMAERHLIILRPPPPIHPAVSGPIDNGRLTLDLDSN